MRKIATLVFSYCLSTSMLSAQSSDYVKKDSSQIFGKISIVKGVVQIKRAANEPAVSYGPNEIQEFYTGGHLYRPFEYNGEKLFFRKIISDSISLYRTKGKFVIEKNGLATEVNRKNFREALLRNSSCEGLSSIPRVTYGRVRLKTAVRMLNTNPCKLRYFPKRQVNLTFGAGKIRIGAASSHFSEQGHVKPVFPVGLYIDLPFYRMPGSSFVLGAEYMNTGYTNFLVKTFDNDVYFDLKAKGVIIPAGIKLSMNRLYLRPFVKAQAVVSYLDISSRSNIIYTAEQDGVVTFRRETFYDKKVKFSGFIGATGIQIPVYRTNSIQLEIKYLKLPGEKISGLEVGFSGFAVDIAYNF